MIKWLARHAKTGSAAPAQMGGYRPKKIIGHYRDWLLRRMAAGDYTLQGLTDELEGQGLKVDYKTIWTFVHDEGQSFKKRMARPVASDFVENTLTSLRQRIRPRA